jgi:SAM-dependent methyltransferase
MSFKDLFSKHAAAYSRYRPAYPVELIEFVAAQAPDRCLAVDCATGNGQAAVALAERFDAVLAVDGSSSQLCRARRHLRVHYAAGMAERLPVRGGSVGLVAAAQAAHWFDLARFYAECRRVLVPDGIVALWTYEKFRVDVAIDAVVDDFYVNVVGGDWPPERRHVEQGYRTLPFPWRELPAPAFQHETEWDLGQVMGYLASWSSVQRHKERTGRDPLPSLERRLAALWPRSGALRLRWPIHLRLGCS